MSRVDAVKQAVKKGPGKQNRGLEREKECPVRAVDEEEAEEAGTGAVAEKLGP